MSLDPTNPIAKVDSSSAVLLDKLYVPYYTIYIQRRNLMTLRQLIKLLRRYPKKATVQIQTSSPRITLCVDQDNN